MPEIRRPVWSVVLIAVVAALVGALVSGVIVAAVDGPPAASRGVAGADGADGADGVDGTVGPSGRDGAPGAAGRDGAVGPAGRDGATGPAGRDGAPGADGADGADVADGQNGADGASAVVRTSDEPAGGNCSSGGVKIESGTDRDADGVLDAGEETGDPVYVCDGAAAPRTVLGYFLPQQLVDGMILTCDAADPTICVSPRLNGLPLAIGTPDDFPFARSVCAQTVGTGWDSTAFEYGGNGTHLRVVGSRWVVATGSFEPWVQLRCKAS